MKKPAFTRASGCYWNYLEEILVGEGLPNGTKKTH